MSPIMPAAITRTTLLQPSNGQSLHRKRLFLLLPTQGYRAEAFVEAAAGLDVDLTIASEEPSSLAAHNPLGLLTLDFHDLAHAARTAARFHEENPIDAVVGVDDATILLQAAIASALGLPSNSVVAVATARNKLRMRERLQAAGLPGPKFFACSIDDNPEALAQRAPYPCVLKPLVLSGSQGVIRVDDPAEFVPAFKRISRLLKEPEIAALGEEARQILVESFIPGPEIALEGLLIDGVLQVLAVFDKPDPMDGPFFEETIYVTPSSHPASVQEAAAVDVRRAATALSLAVGPIHAELRLPPGGPVLLELNPRSIGGRCSRTLQFDGGMSLEELILRRALGIEIPSFRRSGEACGVMMIPVPGAGTLLNFGGEPEALVVPGITELSINAHRGQRLVPLPEGSTYLGFIFARGETPEAVVRSLREAHGCLRFEIN